MRSISALLLLVVGSWAFVVQSAPPEAGKSLSEAEQLRFFENSIRPLLIERCYECHAGDESEGGLRLDLATSLTVGGDSGPLLVPGKPADSLLVSAIDYAELEMPPDEPLSNAEKAAVERWIETGAYWPISGEAEMVADEGPWWAAEPLDCGDPVAVDSPTRIDAYVDSKLAESDLHRAPPADRVV